VRASFYTWTAKEIESVLSRQDSAVFRIRPMELHLAVNVPAQQDIRGELNGKNVLYEAHLDQGDGQKNSA